MMMGLYVLSLTYDPRTGNPTKTTYFKEDGRTIDNIEFYGSNGEVTKIE